MLMAFQCFLILTTQTSAGFISEFKVEFEAYGINLYASKQFNFLTEVDINYRTGYANIHPKKRESFICFKWPPSYLSLTVPVCSVIKCIV